MYRAFADSPSQKSLEALFLENTASLHLKGVVGSGLTFRLADVFERYQKPLLLICEDREKAAYHLNDFEQLLGQESVLFFPSSYRKPYQTETTDNANVLLRSEIGKNVQFCAINLYANSHYKLNFTVIVVTLLQPYFLKIIFVKR